MDTKHIEGKRVFWSSKWDKLWLLIIPVITTIDTLTSDRYSRFAFWAILIISIPAIIYIVWHMIDPRNVWIDRSTPEGAELYALAKELREKDKLDIHFTTEGFLMITQEKQSLVKWENVKSIFVYKLDKYTVDQLVMNIFIKEGIDLYITEDHPCWNELLERVTKAFPGIDSEFYGKLIFPPFETNFNLLYDAEGRSREVAAKEYYND